MNNGQNEGPQGADDLLASLTFSSAQDDARYRCLVDRFDAQAQTEGFREQSSLDDAGEVRKSWCEASGDDGNECMRGYIRFMKNRGSRASVVWAYRERPELPVQQYGYRVTRNPAVDSTAAWSINLDRSRGTDDEFLVIFVPFDGDEADLTNAVSVAADATYEIDGHGVDDVVAMIEPRGTSTELLGMLIESPERFEQLLSGRQDALLAEYERLIAQRTDLDETARAAVTEQARMEIGSQRSTLAENAVEMHGLLREAVLGEECG